MPDVVVAERPALPVLQPFLGGLVAADVEVPGDLGNIRKILRVVDIDLADRIEVRTGSGSDRVPIHRLFNPVIATYRIAGDKLLDPRRFEQVYLP